MENLVILFLNLMGDKALSKILKICLTMNKLSKIITIKVKKVIQLSHQKVNEKKTC